MASLTDTVWLAGPHCPCVSVYVCHMGPQLASLQSTRPSPHTTISRHGFRVSNTEGVCPSPQLLLTTDRMLLPSVPRGMLLPSTLEAVRSSIHRVRDVVVRPSAPSLAECIGLDPERCVSDPL